MDSRPEHSLFERTYQANSHLSLNGLAGHAVTNPSQEKTIGEEKQRGLGTP